jgi:mono/diheme cytochrome c family protein
VKGDGKGVFGPITFPPATDLTKGDAKERSDAQLFYIMKNGLSFTPMPGYASQYSDQDLWAIVSYLRTLQNGPARAPAVPTPTAQQVSFADFQSADPAQRGAAVYFAQGCADCHGAVGDAPGNLALRETRNITRAVRGGRPGMPCYDPSLIDDAQMSDLQAYVATFRANRSGGGEGEGEGGGGEGGFGEGFGEGGPASACAPTG